MLKIENFEVLGWDHAIRGMRNPMNSWEKSDSGYCQRDLLRDCTTCVHKSTDYPVCYSGFDIGPNDYALMKNLRNAGTDHRKFMRMITVYIDITAPLYWWKEFDTYKVGTVANSCSTMHKIHAKEFTLEDFSCEHLFGRDADYEDTFDIFNDNGVDSACCPTEFMKMTCDILNFYRGRYLKTKDKKYWWQMIQLLPTSYKRLKSEADGYAELRSSGEHLQVSS